MESFENLSTPVTTPTEPILKTNKLLAGSFGWMSIGLLVSAVACFIVLTSQTIIDFIFNTQFLFEGLLILEIAFVWYLSANIKKISTKNARLIFIIYSILNGTTLSVIFLVFQLSSIFSIFIATAVMFAMLSIYGMHTKKDLTKIGRLAYFALLGLIIASLINLFISGKVFDLVVSWIGVIVFTILTAYDIQKLKRLGEGSMNEDVDEKKIIIIGALELYLDFINMFLFLLRIFGRRR